MKKLLTAALLTLTTTAAMAQQATQAPDTVVYSKKTYIDLTGTVLEGNVERPGIEVVMGKSKVRFKNMIQVRVNFHRELADSARGL